MDKTQGLLLMAILGHFIGDYLLQPYSMALNKAKRTWKGFSVCLTHCVIYTLAVAAMMEQTQNVWVLGMVFLSHYPIDRYGLAQEWLDIIGGRNIMTDWETTVTYVEQNQIKPILKFPVIVTSFGCIVYTIVDNTLHILLMWVGIIILNHYGLV